MLQLTQLLRNETFLPALNQIRRDENKNTIPPLEVNNFLSIIMDIYACRLAAKWSLTRKKTTKKLHNRICRKQSET